MNCLKKGYDCLVCCGNKLQSPILLLIRLIWGWQFFEAGLGKLKDITKFSEALAGMHFPVPTFNAYLAASAECFGGLFLMLGLLSRLVSIPLAFTMIVAMATAHRADLASVEGILNSGPLPFLIASLVILAFGPGKLSLDYAID
jgi:putative oxidoreductase